MDKPTVDAEKQTQDRSEIALSVVGPRLPLAQSWELRSIYKNVGYPCVENGGGGGYLSLE